MMVSALAYAAPHHYSDDRKLTGRVTDSESGRGLEFVTVALRNSSADLVAAATTDSTGVYVLTASSAAGFRVELQGCFGVVGWSDHRGNSDCEPCAGHSDASEREGRWQTPAA